MRRGWVAGRGLTALAKLHPPPLAGLPPGTPTPALFCPPSFHTFPSSRTAPAPALNSASTEAAYRGLLLVPWHRHWYLRLCCTRSSGVHVLYDTCATVLSQCQSYDTCATVLSQQAMGGLIGLHCPSTHETGTLHNFQTQRYLLESNDTLIGMTATGILIIHNHP